MSDQKNSTALVNSILQAGYVALLEETVEATVGLILTSNQNGQAAKQLEILKLQIEQAYTNLEELVHFLSADDGQLEELTKSQLIQKTFMLVSDPKY